ncbi:MAG: ROK family protein [Acidobacteriaceae bacterium]|nr:ROK family protein [Acidobacteriaceae bacterium]
MVLAGVDVGGTRIKIGLADQCGKLISSRILETHEYNDAESFLRRVVTEIKNQAVGAGVTIQAAGVGCPGRIDFDSGTVVWLKTKLEFLEGIPLSATLADGLGCPVVCDNDVNAILAGEMRFGSGRGHQNVVGITVGTGIGGAIVIAGRMVRGRNWATGHFGYMSIDPCGPRHVSGNTGIFEEHASQSGVVRQLREAMKAGEVSSLTASLERGEEPGLRELFDAAQAGDPLARRFADRMTCELGVLIANLIYALDPELILVGGGLIAHRPDLLDSISGEASLRVAFLPPGATDIRPMALGDAAGVLGGVALAMDAVS